MDGISRRMFGATSLAALLASRGQAAGLEPAAGQFGQINKLTAKAGKFAALHAELSALTTSLLASLPVTLVYGILSHDGHPDTIWTIELWASADAHATTVATQSVQASIGRCKLLTARFENLATFNTVAPSVRRPDAKNY